MGGQTLSYFRALNKSTTNMAAPGSSDHRVSFDETTRLTKNSLNTTVNKMNIMGRQLEEMDGILIVIEENFKNPPDVGTTLEQIADTEGIVLPAYQKILRMQDTLQNMSHELNNSQHGMVKIRSDLTFLEQQQRTEEENYRQNMEDKQCEMEATTTGEMSSAEGNDQVLIATLERLLQQTLTNQQLINNLLQKYPEVLKKIVTINKARDAICRRVMRVMPTLEGLVDSIAERRKRFHGRRSGSSWLSTLTEVTGEEEASMDVEDAAKPNEKGESSGEAKGEKREAEETSEQNMEIEESPKKKRRS